MRIANALCVSQKHKSVLNVLLSPFLDQYPAVDMLLLSKGFALFIYHSQWYSGWVV